jgi:hypothetical protein
VKALLIAMSIEVSFAPGRRVKWRRYREESTMAMFIGLDIEADLVVQAEAARRAAAWVRWGGWWISFEGEEEGMLGVVVVGDVGVGVWLGRAAGSELDCLWLMLGWWNLDLLFVGFVKSSITCCYTARSEW